jgi:hypothetical protein
VHRLPRKKEFSVEQTSNDFSFAWVLAENSRYEKEFVLLSCEFVDRFLS